MSSSGLKKLNCMSCGATENLSSGLHRQTSQLSPAGWPSTPPLPLWGEQDGSQSGRKAGGTAKLLVSLSQAGATHPQGLSRAICPGDVCPFRGAGQIAHQIAGPACSCTRSRSTFVRAIYSAACHQAHAPSSATLACGARPPAARPGGRLHLPAHARLCLCRKREDYLALGMGGGLKAANQRSVSTPYPTGGCLALPGGTGQRSRPLLGIMHCIFAVLPACAWRGGACPAACTRGSPDLNHPGGFAQRD